MAKIPPSIAELLVTGFRAAVSEADPVFLGLMLERPTGETRFLLTFLILPVSAPAWNLSSRRGLSI